MLSHEVRQSKLTRNKCCKKKKKKIGISFLFFLSQQTVFSHLCRLKLKLIKHSIPKMPFFFSPFNPTNSKSKIYSCMCYVLTSWKKTKQKNKKQVNPQIYEARTSQCECLLQLINRSSPV